MKRASFIQSLSLILGAMATTSSLPFEDGPNHVILGTKIKTVDNILSDNIKNKKHLKMFQHMIPSWVKNNKVDVTLPFRRLDNARSEIYKACAIIYISWDEGREIAFLVEDYYWEMRENNESSKTYEHKLNKIYSSFKETQTV